MRTNRSIVKIFLASPGDLVEERRAAKRIVEEENRNHANALGFQMDLVGWEDTVAQHGRAQEIINRDLDQCDYFVGVVWKRWGTPPGPVGTSYTSGFEEEYERSQSRFDATNRPRISLLFKAISDDDIRDAGPQLRQVLEFKRRFTEDYRGAYQTFGDLRDFEERFRSIVALALRNEIDEETGNSSEDKSISPSSDEGQKGNAPISDHGIFEADAHDFIVELIERRQNESGFDYSPAEAARFRLLATSLQLSQNDSEVLGVHDANLIYRDMREGSLTDREKRWLIRGGLAHYESGTSPLWHWLMGSGFSASKELGFATFIGTDQTKKSAFKVLEDLQDDLTGLEGPIDRSWLLDVWLASEDNDFLVSALGYLGECGLLSDVGEIEKHIDASQANVSVAALRAKIEILSRHSIEDALEYVAVRADADISMALVERLFANPSILKTQILERCLDNRSIEFRRSVGAELLRRDALSAEKAISLIESEDAATRLIGTTALSRSLPGYSLSDARSAIVKPKKTAGFLSRGYDHDGEKLYEGFRHEKLVQKSSEELEIRRAREGIYERGYVLALYDKCFSEYHEEIVTNIEDEFEAYFTRKFEATGDPSTLPEEKVLAYIRDNMFQKCFELLCSKKSKPDLVLIRKKVDETNIYFSTATVSYLGRFGDWSDVKRIIRLSSNFRFELSFRGRDRDYILAAATVLDLAVNRVADLLSYEMPHQLRQAIFKLMSRKLFASFDNAQIVKWLGIEIESVRRTVAMKTLQSIPKKRTKEILDSYIGDSKTYYYNALFWLDLGVAADRRTAISVSERVLAQP